MKGLTDQQERFVRYGLIVVGVIAVYISLVYAYFQFESFGSQSQDISLGQAVWYVFLNPTGLGDAGALKLYPATMPGKLIGVVFALSGLSLVGLFVGKVTDMFNEYREYRRLGYYGTDFEDHVIIIGWDEFSRRVVKELVLSGVQVAVVTNKKEEVDLIYDEFGEENLFVLYADYENYKQLEKANIGSAFDVFLNRSADTDTLITLLNLNNEFGDLDLRYVARVNNDELLPAFDIDGAEVDAATTFNVASGLIASHIFEPDAASFGKDMITSVAEMDDYELQQYRVDASNPWEGQSYGALYWDLYEEHSIIALGLSKRDPEQQGRKLVKLPDDEVPVEEGDYVIMVVNGETHAVAEELFDVRQGVRP
jgi:voltage-gated potassium channel